MLINVVHNIYLSLSAKCARGTFTLAHLTTSISLILIH